MTAKKFLIWILTLILTVSTVSAVTYETIFFDDFDSGSFPDDGWTNIVAGFNEASSKITPSGSSKCAYQPQFANMSYSNESWRLDVKHTSAGAGANDYSRTFIGSTVNDCTPTNSVDIRWDCGDTNKMYIRCTGSCSCVEADWGCSGDSAEHTDYMVYNSTNNNISFWRDGSYKASTTVSGCDMDNYYLLHFGRNTGTNANYYNLTKISASGPGPSLTTDVDFTIDNSWTASAINNFSINVSWSNGTTTSHTTTNGTVSLINITSGNINATYWNMTDYFDKDITDTLTVNVSNTVTNETYQAYFCLNASAKVSDAWVTADNFTIDSTTETSCFEIDAGTHNAMAQLSGWFSQNQSFTVAALSNTTQTVENMSYANLTIYAIDGTTNESLSGYDLTILSLNHTGWPGETGSSVTNYSFYVINGTYNVTIDMPGYALSDHQANISVGGHTNHTFVLYKTNSVQIYIWDEITGNAITDNVTIRWSSNATTWENVTSTGELFMSNITADEYELLFYSSNYSTRSYTITVGNRSTQILNAYMISSTYSTIFTIKDIDTAQILDGVSITMYKQINSTWTAVESKYSDISGKAQFYYDPIAHYRFYLSKADYEDYIFYLNPILFSTYDVFMTKSSLLNYSVDFDNIGIIYSPTQFYNNQNTSFNFLITSPDGLLTNYGIKLTYPGGTDGATGVNAIGEQLSADVNLSNATVYDYVVLEFNYTTSLSGERTYTVNLPIISNHSAGTWLTNKDKTYGMGIFERILIATIIIIFVVGIATMVGQALPGVALGLFVYGFLAFIGFIPIWAILPSMLIGVMFLIWKSGGY